MKTKKGRKPVKSSEKRVLVHVYVKRKFKKDFQKQMVEAANRLEDERISDPK